MRGTKYRLVALLLLLSVCGASIAAVLDRDASMLRIRMGANGAGTDTVVYNAGIPASMGGLSGVTAAPQTISTNSMTGGSGVYTVRVVTDLNARGGETDLSADFSYDSSQPLVCSTPATCGSEIIEFSEISWTTRDSDTHTSPTSYNNLADQFIQDQQDTDPTLGGTNNRHRNHFRFQFDNMELLPAGEYVGTITMNGVGQF